MRVTDDVEESSDDEKPVIVMDTWLAQAEVRMTFECQEVTSNGYTYPRSDFHCSKQVFIFARLLLCCHQNLLMENSRGETHYCHTVGEGLGCAS